MPSTSEISAIPAPMRCQTSRRRCSSISTPQPARHRLSRRPSCCVRDRRTGLPVLHYLRSDIDAEVSITRPAHSSVPSNSRIVGSMQSPDTGEAQRHGLHCDLQHVPSCVQRLALPPRNASPRSLRSCSNMIETASRQERATPCRPATDDHAPHVSTAVFDAVDRRNLEPCRQAGVSINDIAVLASRHDQQRDAIPAPQFASANSPRVRRPWHRRPRSGSERIGNARTNAGQGSRRHWSPLESSIQVADLIERSPTSLHPVRQTLGNNCQRLAIKPSQRHIECVCQPRTPGPAMAFAQVVAYLRSASSVHRHHRRVSRTPSAIHSAASLLSSTVMSRIQSRGRGFTQTEGRDSRSRPRGTKRCKLRHHRD